MAVSSTRMDKGAPVRRGYPPSSKKGGDASSSLSSGVRASAIPQPLISQKVSWNNVFIVLAFCMTHVSMISAQINFSMQSTSYNCSSNMICLGDAHRYTGNDSRIQVGRLSLTTEMGNQGNRVGVAYYNQRVQLLDLSTAQSASFNTSFTIDTVWGVYNDRYITGDGMTFVLIADNNYSGGLGGSLGIFNEGITPFKSIVVEFDTYLNKYSPEYDISDNHVSFDFTNITYAAAASASNVNVNLADEKTVYAWVEYSNEIQQLEVRISNSNSRPISPLLSYAMNLSDFVEEYMWVGFSSSTGANYANFYIGNWTFESYGIIPTGGKSEGSKVGLTVGLSVGVPAFLLACVVIAILLYRRPRSRGELGWSAAMIEDPMMQVEGMPERFSYKQLSVATRAFSEESKLGQGGFGSVYRGVDYANIYEQL